MLIKMLFAPLQFRDDFVWHWRIVDRVIDAILKILDELNFLRASKFEDFGKFRSHAI
jgi:hypothetical protein